MAYRITNRTELPVNIDELSIKIEPHQSVIVDTITPHILELRVIGILQTRKLSDESTSIEGLAPRRKSK